MLIGYQRVSTDDQNLDLQRQALIEAGVDPQNIYEDRMSGSVRERPGLDNALRALREGDTLVVWRLDRLARSLKDLIRISEQLADRGVGLRSLKESIDTSTATGRLYFHLMGALAEFERNLIRERTMAGLEAARRRGRKPGRKPKMTDRKLAAALALVDEGRLLRREIAQEIGVSESTLFKALADHERVERVRKTYKGQG